MAAVAADPRVDLAAVRNPSPALHAGAAMLLLLLAAALSIYMPRGMTRYGWRRRQQERDGDRPATASGCGLRDAHSSSPTGHSAR